MNSDDIARDVAEHLQHRQDHREAIRSIALVWLFVAISPPFLLIQAPDWIASWWFHTNWVPLLWLSVMLFAPGAILMVLSYPKTPRQ